VEILPQAFSNPIESGLESLAKNLNYSFIDIIPNLHDFISSLVNHMVWFIAKTPVLITAYCFSWLLQPVFHNLLVKWPQNKQHSLASYCNCFSSLQKKIGSTQRCSSHLNVGHCQGLCSFFCDSLVLELRRVGPHLIDSAINAILKTHTHLAPQNIFTAKHTQLVVCIPV